MTSSGQSGLTIGVGGFVFPSLSPLVGERVAAVGDSVGFFVGSSVGDSVGDVVGFLVGAGVGDLVGTSVGDEVGDILVEGESVGVELG